MERIFVTLPIPFSTIKENYARTDYVYVINYTTSKIKGKPFFAYIANSRIPVELIFDNKDDLYEAAKAYLNHPTHLKIETLDRFLIAALLSYKGIAESSDIVRGFATKEREILRYWVSVLESSSLLVFYSLRHLDDYSEGMEYEINLHRKDLTEETLGFNILNCFEYADFYHFFNRLVCDEIVNYEYLFTEYCFDGKNFFHFWNKEANFFLDQAKGLLLSSEDLKECLNV